jgi:hypothetical protein
LDMLAPDESWFNGSTQSRSKTAWAVRTQLSVREQLGQYQVSIGQSFINARATVFIKLYCQINLGYYFG